MEGLMNENDIDFWHWCYWHDFRKRCRIYFPKDKSGTFLARQKKRAARLRVFLVFYVVSI